MLLTANGASVYCEKSGETGEQVLLLHGWGCTTEHFRPIIQALEKDYRLTVIDFPGHGKSGRPPEPWGVKDFADAVVDVMDQLGIEKCHLIAHSFGGRVSLHLAAHHPERIGKMVLTGCAGLKKPQTEEQKKRSQAYQKKKQQLQNLQKLPLIGKLAENAMEKLQLSARAYSRILKVARTIADMDNCADVKAQHIAEAIGYRQLDRGDWAERGS